MVKYNIEPLGISRISQIDNFRKIESKEIQKKKYPIKGLLGHIHLNKLIEISKLAFQMNLLITNLLVIV